MKTSDKLRGMNMELPQELNELCYSFLCGNCINCNKNKCIWKNNMCEKCYTECMKHCLFCSVDHEIIQYNSCVDRNISNLIFVIGISLPVMILLTIYVGDMAIYIIDIFMYRGIPILITYI